MTACLSSMPRSKVTLGSGGGRAVQSSAPGLRCPCGAAQLLERPLRLPLRPCLPPPVTTTVAAAMWVVVMVPWLSNLP